MITQERRKALSLFVFMAAMTLLGACRQVEENRNLLSDSLVEIGATAPVTQRNTSVELSRIQFDDIPVPPGFFFRNHRNESYSFVNGPWRCGRFVYWCKRSEEEVGAQYLELMPKDPYNWSLISAPEQPTSGPWIFEKNGERCVIETQRERRTPAGSVAVTLTVRKYGKS